MFEVYFGKFLQQEGVLTEAEYQNLMEKSRTARLKLGPLAVLEGYMTESQAEEVNAIQAMKDIRFGDIAIEKGYLTKEKLEALLKKQGDSYLLTIQTLMDMKGLSQEELQGELQKFKKAEGYTAYEMEALKSADIDRIIPIFTKDSSCPVLIQDYIALIARNFIRFIDNKVRFERMERINQYHADYMSAQELAGQNGLLIALCGNKADQGIVRMASLYIKEELEKADEDVLDAACEFINVSNGLFATKLSIEDIEMNMEPPIMKETPVMLSTDGVMYKMPIYVAGERLDLVICMESRWSISE
jgi:hypothetical protein